MRELKIRGIVGNVLVLLSSLLSLGALALPMLVEIGKGQLYSVFSSIFNLKSISDTLGTDGNLYVISAAIMIAFAIIALAMVILSIISLVGACLDKKSLSMAIALRILSLFNVVLASISLTLLVLYFAVNAITATTYGYGIISALGVMALAIAGSFTAPSKNRYIRPVKLAKIEDN